MKKVLIIQATQMIAIAIVLYLTTGTHQAVSSLYGSLVVLINLAMLTWTWSRILKKKQIAIAVSVIVFKYGIFAVIIYTLLKNPAIDTAWFCVGLSTVLSTVLLAAIKLNKVGG